MFWSKNQFANLYVSWRGKNFLKKAWVLTRWIFIVLSNPGVIILGMPVNAVNLLSSAQSSNKRIIPASWKEAQGAAVSRKSVDLQCSRGMLQRHGSKEFTCPQRTRFLLTIKKDNNIDASLPLPTGYHQISNVVWDFSVFTA